MLAKYGVEMIGAKREAIEMAEDRKLFREAMDRIGLENPQGDDRHRAEAGRRQAPTSRRACGSRMDDARICRPARDHPPRLHARRHRRRRGLQPRRLRILLPLGHGRLARGPDPRSTRSLLGWKEFEMEVVRDKADNAIIVCAIENVDPMGVHTGDSITVAPALTLTDKEYQIMRNGSIAVLREIGVETGGSNVQWAVNPDDGRMVVIEMNPRVSRSSALASKATGFPDRQDRGQARRRLHARRARQRHHQGHARLLRADHRLRRHQDPALRLREVPGLRAAPDHRDEIRGRGDGHRPHHPRDRCRRRWRRWKPASPASTRSTIPGAPGQCRRSSRRSRTQTPDRMRVIAQAMRHGLSDDDIHARHHVRSRGSWPASARSSRPRPRCARTACRPTEDGLRQLKMMGFTDARLATLTGRDEDDVRRARLNLGVTAVFKRIDTCAAEFEAQTPYMYSTYETPDDGRGRMRGAALATARRSSSSAAARTGSGRGSSSTTAAATPASR